MSSATLIAFLVSYNLLGYHWQWPGSCESGGVMTGIRHYDYDTLTGFQTHDAVNDEIVRAWITMTISLWESPGSKFHFDRIEGSGDICFEWVTSQDFKNANYPTSDPAITVLNSSSSGFLLDALIWLNRNPYKDTDNPATYCWNFDNYLNER